MSAEETDSHHVGTNFTWDIEGRCTDLGYEKYPRRQMPHADPETSLHAGLIELNSSNATLYFHNGVDFLSLWFCLYLTHHVVRQRYRGCRKQSHPGHARRLNAKLLTKPHRKGRSQRV